MKISKRKRKKNCVYYVRRVMGRGCLKGSNDLRTGAEGPTDKRSIGTVDYNKKIIRQKKKCIKENI